ncbi:MAG: hypothetical protein GDA52_02560 [Rhodobacteraceae bacterium]|nr:hypothetical protein [Paracoccaceae bacterium]
MSKSRQAESTADVRTSALVVRDKAKGAPPEVDDSTKRWQDAYIADFEQDTTLRKHFSWATYGLLLFWLLFVAGFLIWSSRSDAVLLALISGATIKLIGLYYIVLRYIFPQQNGTGD